MNCANHPDRERSAFCQNCGKPLCTECTRIIGTSIFCEPCYTLRSATNPVSPAGAYVPPVAPVPSPGLAALLGFIPGVGAMYNGQYVKGLVHLIVFVLLISLADQHDVFGLFVAGWIGYMVIESYHTARARRDGAPLPNPFGLNDLGERLGFGKSWPSGPGYVPPVPGYAPPNAGYAPPVSGYAAPNPGYATTNASYVPPVPGADPVNPGFTGTVPPASGSYAGAPPNPPYSYTYVPPTASWGAPQDAWSNPVSPAPDPNLPVDMPPIRRFPAGALWLIGLGILFLLGNTGIFFIRVRFLGPLLLIALGVWVFVRRMTSTGLGLENDGTPAYTWRLARAASGAIWLVTTGVMWLLDTFDILSWGRSWPLLLIVAGLLAFLKRSLPSGYSAPGCYPGTNCGYPSYPGASVPPSGPITPPPAPPSTAIVPSSERPIAEEGR